MVNQYTRIYIIRHGESLGNAHYAKGGGPLYSNELGTDLSDLGVKQAQFIAKKLSKIHFDAIFSSDFIRAKRTAEIIALEQKLEVIATKVIRERNIGSLEGKMTSDVAKKIKLLQQGLSDEEKMKIKFVPDIESEDELASRFITFLREVAIAYQGKNILAVAHGNIMRSFLVHIGFAKYDELPFDSVKNTGYVKLESDGINFFVKETWGINKNLLETTG